MTRLEEIGIVTLKKLGIHAERRRDAAAYIGLWVDGKKIASMGIRVSRWVTSFGFAMNLDGDYAASQYVRPCGIEGLRLTTIEDILGQAPSRVQVMDLIRESFQSVFQRTLEPMRQELLPALNDFLAD
jgi:lipoate-protein ligase B